MSTRITKQRLRITFGKANTLRFIGHLDVAKLWERVLRRAQLPLEYTQGFNRHPRIQFADALPLGLTSQAELLDIWLEEWIPVDEALKDHLRQVSPRDLKIHSIIETDIQSPALPTLARAAVYHLRATPPDQFPADMPTRLEGVLNAPEIMRERKGKPYDLRPLIYTLEMDGETCQATLALQEGKTGRPGELINSLALDDLRLQIHRQVILLESAFPTAGISSPEPLPPLPLPT